MPPGMPPPLQMWQDIPMYYTSENAEKNSACLPQVTTKLEQF
jgi:hypothetical protein